MQWKVVGGSLVGALVVAAACSSSPRTDVAPSDSGGVVDAIADVLGLDHVESDAVAAEKPTIDTVKCDKTAGSYAYAEKMYPGRTKEDLARASALICGGTLFPGYDCASAGIVVRDGAIAVACGSKTGLIATIVMPPPL
jgi:hypothetical protein